MPHPSLRPSALLLAVLAAAALPSAVPAASAQSRAAAAPLSADALRQQRDSLRVLREARAAQAEFERARFRHMPWTFEHGVGGSCDERIGRFCFTNDDSDVNWKPPPEKPEVKAARERLLDALDDAAAAHPGDGWVAGQRVRYRVEAGRAEAALASARECRAEGWWCRALEGMALHASGDAAGAEAAFAAALGAMPERERRRWGDLSPFFVGDDLRAWRRARGAARDSLARRIWWLADPLWMDAGNDRRSEHHYRLVMDRVQERAESAETLSWGDDLREILLRYGWPVGWERLRQRVGQVGRPSVLSHYAPRSWDFLPPLRVLSRPSALKEGDWRLGEKTARTLHAPPYATAFRPLEHQVAAFRRGASSVVVAAWEMDSVPRVEPVEAGLVLMRHEASPASVARGSFVGPRGVLRVETAPGPAVLSLEARAPGIRRVARARYGVPLAATAGVSVSDVLLLEDGGSLPETLDDAVSRARASDRVRPGERLGLFWEVYGLPARPDTVAVSVSVVPRRVGGAARRAAERVGLVSPGVPVRMGWREETEGGGVLARSIGVALPRLAPGEYLLEVTVRVGAAAPVVASRRLRVAR